MKPAPFDYAAVESIDEALALLHGADDSVRVLAGGQSLMPILNMRLATPGLLLDINGIADLKKISIDGDQLYVGAGVTQATLQAYAGLAESVPLLARVLPFVGHFQTRNRGTVCGSLAHADPSAELPLCLATLGGDIVLRSRSGERTLAAQEFFQGMLMTARRPDELVVAARFPIRREGWRYAFDEVAMRHGDFAIAAVAVVATPEKWYLGVGGLADRPVVKALSPESGAAFDAALNDFVWSLGAQDDHLASAAYRREMVRYLGHKLTQEVRS